MKQKYIKEIYNLVTQTESNKQMSGDQLRAAIEQIFLDSHREKLGLSIKALVLTGHRSSETLTTKYYSKKAGA